MRRTALTACCVLLAATTTVAASTVGHPSAPTDGVRGGRPAPGVSPPGANDWTCRPDSRHPFPVVLVHGTFGDMTVSWNAMSPALKTLGYCVFALDYGDRATGPIEESAEELSAFVDDVLEATRAPKVSLVGHSQGGMMPRYYIKNLGGAGVVEDLVGLAPSNHGTRRAGELSFEEPCRACDQQAWGSPFLTTLNSGDETPGLVDYTQVVTRYDEVVVPYTSGYLTPDGNSTNILLQDSCALDTTEHLGIVYDRVAIGWTVNALGQEGPAEADARVGCA